MHVSRLVSLISRPGLAPVLGSLYRTISSGTDHVRLGNVTGKTKPPPHRELDVLLGRWCHDPSNPYGSLVVAGAPMKGRGYINLARNNGIWIYEQGVSGGKGTVTYRFTLDTIFVPHSVDGNVFRAKVEQYIPNGLRFSFCTLVDDAVIFSFTAEAIQDKLFLRTRNDDGSFVTKVYLRQ